MTLKTPVPPLHLLALLAGALLLGGCASSPIVHKGSDARYETTPPRQPKAPEHNHGAIYQTVSAQGLFEDFKARRVGDILTVVLAERTNARKSANAASSKDSSVRMVGPTVFGRPVTRNGTPILDTDVTASRDFEGQGDAAQSNLLEGSITVTVAEVQANGNLVVQGEKWMRINQGEEYIRIRGIVRPVDIRTDNTVLSTQIADAQLAYGGTGHLAQSNSPGWASRFFNSPLWPF